MIHELKQERNYKCKSATRHRAVFSETKGPLPGGGRSDHKQWFLGNYPYIRRRSMAKGNEPVGGTPPTRLQLSCKQRSENLALRHFTASNSYDSIPGTHRTANYDYNSTACTCVSLYPALLSTSRGSLKSSIAIFHLDRIEFSISCFLPNQPHPRARARDAYWTHTRNRHPVHTHTRYSEL